MSGFYVDLLWFREVKLSSVFWSVLRTKFMLGLIFGLVFFALLYVNLLIVRWLTPTTRILTPEQEAVDRVRQSLEPYLRWLIPLAAAALALIVGIGVSRQWQVFLLWRNGSGLSFGSTEPIFHRDPSFYVFSLPWLRFLQGWLFSSLVGVTLIVGIAHFVWGGIQPQAPVFADKVSPAVRAHLSVLLGLIFLVKAWGYYLGRFDLLTSPRGVVEGASYTDVKAQLPALNFLAIVAVICAILFLVNIRVRLWSLPVIAVGGLALVSVLLGTAYPAFVQQFSVKPQEQQRETPYIKYNIEGTRRAFQLDTIDVSERPADPVVTADALAENEATVSNIRLWRPTVLKENFQSLQRIRQYYEFAGRGRRSVRPERHASRPDGLGPRGDAERDPHGRQDLAEHAPGLHARVRRGRGAGEHRVHRGCAGAHAPRHPARRPAHDRAAADLLRRTERRPVRGHEHRREGAGLRGRVAGAGHDLLRHRRHPDGQLPAAGAVRVAVQGHQPPDLQPHPSGQPDHDLPRPPGARAEARAVPEAGLRPVPRGRGREAAVDLRRVHHDDRVPVLAGDRPERCHRRLDRTAARTTCGTRSR